MSEMENKRVLAIVGSPRRGGNTETIVDEILRGAESAGASSEKVILSELRIGPCQACDGCRNTGACVQQDDMPSVIERMRDSQVWVLGTPVYWWGPSAQFKTFLDRWYQIGPAYKQNFGGKRIVLAIAFEDKKRTTARHIIGMMKDALKYIDAELFATVLAPGVWKAGEARQRPKILATAQRVGRNSIVKRSDKRKKGKR